MSLKLVTQLLLLFLQIQKCLTGDGCKWKNRKGIKGVTYPIVADTNKTISKNFDVLTGDYFINEEDELEADAELIAYRGLFLIDKDGIVQHQVVTTFLWEECR